MQIACLVPLTNDGDERLIDSTKETIDAEHIEITVENELVIDSTKETTYVGHIETTAENTTDAEHIKTIADNESVRDTESKNFPTSENTT